MALSSGSKAILIILDGLGDRQSKKSGWKTPLQLARKPAMDKMACEGMCGLLYSISPGVVPGSDTAHLEILGYETPKYYPKRGPLEALGANIKLNHNDVAFRANFATVDEKMNVIDRRAGRIDTQTARKLADALKGIVIDGVNVTVKHTVEHRCVVVLRGIGGDDVTETDPHENGKRLECKPLESRSAKTAQVVNKLAMEVYGRLMNHPINKARKASKLPEANMLILRGGGEYFPVPTFAVRFGMNATCIAAGALYKGIARFVGMSAPDVPGATGDGNSNLKNKLVAARKALKSHDFVFLHIKATDNFSHDGMCLKKAKMIEKIDREVIAPLLKAIGNDVVIVLTGDHSTPCCKGEHSGDPTPIVFYKKDNTRRDGVKKFDELNCAQGSLGWIEGKHVMPIIMNLTDRAKKYGA
ncbi:phosphoglycerate mutase [Candidatus Micrarchaeota archaeon CG08_land_8_20_14_0_20_49_17]|nr:MAG: hypothetical protein AUJ13_04645 [Candidatus Micrarchaeota archaeon CG1_02_49_24]PIU09303.1 MAG: phosphoglycerate mutase [Candidatus Micrarchaeota archaeon CG08_land_8_20_14_0_20_49_17]HII53921.1 2,3-bisphosphoglycerate-independent phosphoglycerate mutase [Candidatus Micrarchaeota archaeon]